MVICKTFSKNYVVNQSWVLSSIHRKTQGEVGRFVVNSCAYIGGVSRRKSLHTKKNINQTVPLCYGQPCDILGLIEPGTH